jgi:hypothetical protein
VSTQFARFVVRSGCRGALIGLNVNGLLKEGVVYEVVDILGDLVIREVGPSPLGMKDLKEARSRYGFNNAQSVESIMSDHGGRFVMTCAGLETGDEAKP